MKAVIIKSEKPFTEQKVVSKNKEDSFTIGIKAYSHKDLVKKRKDFTDLSQGEKILRLLRRLENTASDISKPEEEIALESELLRSEINQLSEASDELRTEFLKNEILYIKGLNLQYRDESGQIHSHTVKDSREEKELGSLWNNSEDCLVVLLDTLLESEFLREPILEAVQKGLFNIDFKSAEVKN